MINRWQCTWCHHRSREEVRIRVLINNQGIKTHRQNFCSVKCYKDFVIVWADFESTLACAGCAKRFTPTDGRQKYHDGSCRKRAWSKTHQLGTV